MNKPVFSLVLTVAAVVLTLSQRVLAESGTFMVDPEAGNNTFNAVFDAAIGERITALSSAVGCTITADEEKHDGHAKCSVPLTSIKVDSDDTKMVRLSRCISTATFRRSCMGGPHNGSVCCALRQLFFPFELQRPNDGFATSSISATACSARAKAQHSAVALTLFPRRTLSLSSSNFWPPS